MQNTFPFSQDQLDYDYVGLMPYCDPDTLVLHYEKLYGSYVNMLNYLLSAYPQCHTWPIEQLILEELPYVPQTQKRQIKHFAGAVYNHTLYFKELSSTSGGSPQGKLKDAIDITYGSFENFKLVFKQAAYNVLGSGWVWLNSSKDGNIHITITEGNKTPELYALQPLFVADVWEHAYYLKYPAQLGKYIDQWFEVLDWEQAGKRFEESI